MMNGLLLRAASNARHTYSPSIPSIHSIRPAERSNTHISDDHQAIGVPAVKYSTITLIPITSEKIKNRNPAIHISLTGI